MSSSHHFKQDSSAAEIAICDLGLFQVLIPTERHWTRTKRQGPGRFNLPRRQRIYRERGWVFYRGYIIGGLSGLRLNPLRTNHMPPALIPQIMVGRPFSFEMHSQMQIPTAIAQRASFLYQFNPAPMLHYALLQNLIPQFVRIYPFRSSASLEKLTRKFLKEEKAKLGY